jgi:glycosyltransferase involved in cell wall biosynthesis
MEGYLSLPSTPSGKVVFAGEVDDKQKKPLYENARAFLMPITRPEPFGLVMVEAMMSGTPVIAYDCGSTPEIVDNDKTGFIVKNLEEMVEAIGDVGRLSSSECRDVSVKRFSKGKMVDRYLEIYRDVIENSRKN